MKGEPSNLNSEIKENQGISSGGCNNCAFYCKLTNKNCERYSKYFERLPCGTFRCGICWLNGRKKDIVSHIVDKHLNSDERKVRK